MTRTLAPAARLYRQLAAYLDAHPRAADSLEGVMRFWLGLQYADDKLQDDVQQALACLMSRGLLSKKSSSDGTVLYFACAKQPTGELKDEPAP